MKLNDLPFPLVPVVAPGADPCAARDCAERIGRRLWRGDQLDGWMRCVPELALAGVGAAHLAALVCEEAEGLIRNTILALSREPEEARSGEDDIEALVCAVSRFDPPVRNIRRLLTCECPYHALACALAVGAVRGMLGAMTCRASSSLRIPPFI